MDTLVRLTRAASSRSIGFGIAIALLLFCTPRAALGQGACCFGPGNCAFVDEPTCLLEFGGVFQGDGVPCTPGLCAGAPIGACCFPGGLCAPTLEMDCLNGLGVFFGVGSVCTPVLCDSLPPRGACCTAAFGCIDADLQSCAAIGGRFIGPGSLCNETTCLTDLPDADGDGIPDDLDPTPWFYNPGFEPFPHPLWLQQVTWIGTDGVVLQEHSSLGLVGIPAVNTENSLLWINVQIDGDWRIRNWPVSGVNFAPGAPIERHWTGFIIGPDGVQVEQADVAYTVTRDPLDILIPFPPDAPSFIVPVEPSIQQKGSAGPGPGGGPDPNIDSIPQLPLNTGLFNFAPVDPTQIQLTTRPDFNFADLDEPSEENSCGPAAVASSFKWLERTYKLPLAPDATKSNLVDEFERRMKTDPVSGTQMSDLLDGKRQFVVKNKLPITIESQGRGTPNPGAVNPEDLFKQMKLGQDVEIFIRFGGDDNDDEGHFASLVQMKKEGDKYTITTLDDENQSAPGGNDRSLEGQLVMENGEWFYTDAIGKAKFVGWAAESPTEAAVNRAITNCARDLRDALAMGAPPTADARAALLKLACLLEYRTMVLLEAAACRMPPADPDELAHIAAMNAKAKTTKIMALLGLRSPGTSPYAPAYIATAHACANQLHALSNALRDSKPLDTDDDGIPDELDNAPNSANPDQTDCNNDGIGDVDQLENNDCNDNGIPDDCDIANGTSADNNMNGIPDECEPCPCDRDGDGIKTISDYFVFLNEFFSQLGGPGSADVDGDGTVTIGDYFVFLGCLEAISMSEPCP